MKEQLFNHYLLTREEYMVLLAGRGEEQVTVFQTAPEGVLSEREIHETLFQLFRKNILEWKEDGSYEVKPELYELLCGIKEARTEMMLRFRNSPAAGLCYFGERIVIVEQSETIHHGVRLHGLQEEEFWQELEDRHFLPEEHLERRDMMTEKKDVEESVLPGSETDAAAAGVCNLWKHGKICTESLETWFCREPEVHCYIACKSRKMLGKDFLVYCQEIENRLDLVVSKDASAERMPYALDLLKGICKGYIAET